MANSRLFQFNYSYERDLVRLQFKIAIGASGAPTISNGKGLVSITRNSTGNYTLVLKDKFYLFMNSNITFLVNGDPAAPLVNILSESVNNTKAIILQTQNTSQAVTDPASGEVMLIELVVRNAST